MKQSCNDISFKQDDETIHPQNISSCESGILSRSGDDICKQSGRFIVYHYAW